MLPGLVELVTGEAQDEWTVSEAAMSRAAGVGTGMLSGVGQGVRKDSMDRVLGPAETVVPPA